MNYKTIVAPVIAFIAVTLQLVFGITIDEEILNQFSLAVVNVLVLGITLYGIITNHKKEG